MIDFFRKKIQIIVGDKNLVHLLRNGFFVLVVGFFGYLGNYFFIWLVGNWYGPEGLGYLGIAQTVTGLSIQLSLMGLGTLILKLAGQRRGNGNISDIGPLFLKIVQISTSIAIFICIVLFLSRPLLNKYLFQGSLNNIFLLLISASILFGVIHNLNFQLFRALDKMSISELLRSGIQLIGVVSLVLFYRISLFEATKPAYSYLFSLIIIGSIGICVYKYFFKKNAEFNLQKTTITKSGLLRLSFPMFVAGLSDMILRYVDTLIVGIYLEPTSVGIYTAALKASMIIGIPLSLFGGFIAPEIARLQKQNKTQDLSRVLRLFGFILIIMTAPIIAVFLIFPNFILSLLGSGFEGGGSALRVLTIGYMIHVWSGNNALYMNMVGYEKQYRNIVLVTTLLNIVLNLSLIGKYGIMGSAVATCISLCVWNLWANTFIYRKDKIRTFFWI